MSRFVWAKRKARSFDVNAFELRKDGDVHAVVQESPGGWFSYGMKGSWNTSSTPTDQLSAMKDALTRARQAQGGEE